MVLRSQDIYQIIRDFKAGRKTSLLTVDFGKQVLEVKIQNNEIILPDGRKIKIPFRVKKNFLYYITNDEIIPIAWFCEHTGLYYKLIPTNDWPTISLSSVLMRGKLFHYTPLPGVKRGRNFPDKVKTKLKSARFSNIRYFSSTQGFLCFKLG